MALFDWLFGTRNIFEFATAGPAEDEHPFTTVTDRVTAANTGTFRGGVYEGARWVPAHRGRIGGSIVPQAVVVHTTDMVPKSFDALVNAWNTRGGAPNMYSAAHFVLGPTAKQGLVQMVPITRNANHAGGETKNGFTYHGWWVTKDGRFIHPNTISVGIEVHNAGLLTWKPGSLQTAQFIENKKVVAEFSRAEGEVYVDSLGRPWEAVTEYALVQLATLLSALRSSLKPLEPGVTHKGDAAYIKDRSRWDTSYAYAQAHGLVGHVSLDPINKTDPGPQLMAFINNFAQNEGWV